MLGNLACNDELREVLVQNGALSAVVAVLNKPKLNVDVARIATWAVYNFTTANKKAQKQLGYNLGVVLSMFVIATPLQLPPAWWLDVPPPPSPKTGLVDVCPGLTNFFLH